jgi:hypothetical protein
MMKLLRCGDWSIHIDNKIDHPDARSKLNLRSQSMIREYRRQRRRSLEDVFEVDSVLPPCARRIAEPFGVHTKTTVIVDRR